jgi:hypothetical protein
MDTGVSQNLPQEFGGKARKSIHQVQMQSIRGKKDGKRRKKKKSSKSEMIFNPLSVQSPTGGMPPCVNQSISSSH